MIKFSEIAYEALKGANPQNPIGWWKKSKIATLWVLLVLVFELPLFIIRCLIMAICFIPHKIYEELEYL